MTSLYFRISALALFWLVSQVLSSTGYKHGQKVLPERSTEKSVNCSSFPGRYPGNIENSNYYLMDNGSICCSETKNCAISDEDMEQICGEDRGTVFEPCFQCKTCGHIKGEACNGQQYQNGRCNPKYSCINENGTVIKYEYDDGICTDKKGPRKNQNPGEACGGKYGYLGTCESNSRCVLKQDKDYGVCIKYAKTKGLNKKCGGRYGIHGRCSEGFRCTADEDEFLKGTVRQVTCLGVTSDQVGVCYNASTDVCFKNCHIKPFRPVCADNGTWFDNGCHMRQCNCPLLPHEKRLRKADNISICGLKPTARTVTSDECQLSGGSHTEPPSPLTSEAVIRSLLP